MADTKLIPDTTLPDEDQPVFDYSNYSHGDYRELDIQQKRLARLNVQLYDYDQYATDDAFEAALTQYRKMSMDVNGFLCRVLVSVPRAYLVENAPVKLDWNDPKSLQYIRHDKMRELRDLAIEARKPENVSGNSRKT